MLPIACACGAVTGTLHDPSAHNAVACACRDCQAYARWLGTAVTDPRGATPILQVTPSQVELTGGHAHLAAVRLSPSGLMRWYAACCRTPIGNSLPMERPVFIGVVGPCLPPGATRAARPINLASARPPARDRLADVIPAILGGLRVVLLALITGRRSSPFPASTDPRVRVLTASERAALDAEDRA